METEKSGKLAIATRETYLQLDRLVSILEIRERKNEKQLNRHSNMWIKMTGMSERQGQE